MGTCTVPDTAGTARVPPGSRRWTARPRPAYARAPMPAPAVSLRGITRRFGSLLANDAVSLDLAPGEIHALVGEEFQGLVTIGGMERFKSSRA